jgi:TPR repeat protein
MEKNDKEAFRLYTLTCEMDFIAGYYAVGWCYENEIGVVKDLAQAAKFYAISAERNFAPAFDMLGQCYKLGQGVPADAKLAAKYYRIAATMNVSHAANEYGVLCFNGEGLTQDFKEALFWFRSAAALDNATSMTWIAHCFQNSFGVTKNLVLASCLYEIAISKKNEYASSAVKRLPLTSVRSLVRLLFADWFSLAG